MLVNRTNLPRHVPWMVFALAATVLAITWYVADGLRRPGAAGGGTLPGLSFGIVGGAIIVFEFLLWPRKMVRAWRVGRAEAWLRAHIWLGLLTVPLIVLHSGFRWGGLLSTMLLAMFLIVIASGVAGLLLQQLLPTVMLDELPAETIYTQIDHVLGEIRADADRLVAAVCGTASQGGDGDSAVAGDDRPITFEVMRRVGAVEGRVLEVVLPGEPVPGAELLEQFYHRTVRPFLEPSGVRASTLRMPKQAERAFHELRLRVGPAAEPAVHALEKVCEQRRQFDRQARLHFWLHSWLCIHLPVSAALLGLMALHAWKALEYW